jgi:hypothetical protein
MSATVPYSAVQAHSNFDTFREGKARWVLTLPDGSKCVCQDWVLTSPFGEIKPGVTLHPDGSPNFDRPYYREAPNVNIVAWGRTASGEARLAVIRQAREQSDDPEARGTDGHPSVVFGQVPMGFLERLIGKDMVERFESVEKGARRETMEESGASVIKSITRPACPWHNPSPSFTASWSDLVFVEVDLEAVERLKYDRNEPILTAEYISVPELLKRIREGRDSAGAVYRGCTSNSVWMIFFATYPEMFVAPLRATRLTGPTSKNGGLFHLYKTLKVANLWPYAKARHHFRHNVFPFSRRGRSCHERSHRSHPGLAIRFILRQDSSRPRTDRKNRKCHGASFGDWETC